MDDYYFFDTLAEDDFLDLQGFLVEPVGDNSHDYSDSYADVQALQPQDTYDDYEETAAADPQAIESIEFWDTPVLEEFMQSRTWVIGRLVLYAVAILLIFIANVTLLATIRGVRYLKTTLNRYVASLAVCDITMGLYAVVRLVGLSLGPLSNNTYFCLGHTLGLVCVSTVAQLMMLYIAFDCYFSIWHPIKYGHVLAPWKASVAIFLAWIYAGAVSLLPLLWFVNWRSMVVSSSSVEASQECYMEYLLDSNYVMFLLAHYGIAVVIVVSVYIFIYYEIRTKKVIFSVYQQRLRQRQMYEDRRKRDIQNAHCMAIASLIFVVFWLPHFFLLAVHVFVVRLRITSLLESVALFLVVYHSSFNPLIYICKLDTFQVACYKVLCCCPGQEFPSRPPSDNIHLHSMSFRNHVTGSMMSLHTTLAGKMVRLPRITVTGTEESADDWPPYSPEPSQTYSPGELSPSRPSGGIIDSEIVVYHGDDGADGEGMAYPGEIYHRNSSQHIVGSPTSVDRPQRTSSARSGASRRSSRAESAGRHSSLSQRTHTSDISQGKYSSPDKYSSPNSPGRLDTPGRLSASPGRPFNTSPGLASAYSPGREYTMRASTPGPGRLRSTHYPYSPESSIMDTYNRVEELILKTDTLTPAVDHLSLKNMDIHASTDSPGRPSCSRNRNHSNSPSYYDESDNSSVNSAEEVQRIQPQWPTEGTTDRTKDPPSKHKGRSTPRADRAAHADSYKRY